MDKYSSIKLEGMEFRGFIGCLESEKKVKNTIIIDFCGSLEIGKAAKSDDISKAVDYSRIYDVLAEEVSRGYNLVEALAAACCKAIERQFPQFACFELKVSKVRPILAGGQMALASVIVTHGYDE